MDKQKLLGEIQKAAKNYDSILNHNELLILAKAKKDIIYFNVKFDATNFLHLTGLKTDLSAKDFFDYSLNSKLSINHISLKYSEKLTRTKIKAFDYLIQIHKTAKTIGEYNGNGFNLKTDKILGNISVSLGLVNDRATKKYFAPNSLMQADSRDLTKSPFMPVVAMFLKKTNDNFYDTITYKSKNINIDKLHFPKEIKELLSKNALQELIPSLNSKEHITEQDISIEPVEPTRALSLKDRLSNADKKINTVNHSQQNYKNKNNHFEL